jgi:hypothetical protein
MLVKNKIKTWKRGVMMAKKTAIFTWIVKKQYTVDFGE